MKIKLHELSDDNSAILVTRPLANRLRKKIDKQIKSSWDDTIEFDFSDITAVDASFIDELIFRLLEDIKKGELPRKYFFLSHMSESAEYEARQIFKAKKQPILLKLNRELGWNLLSGVEQNLFEALELVMERKKMTTTELKKLLGVPANTASMRLIKLFKRGLIKREERITKTGREYVYFSLF